MLEKLEIEFSDHAEKQNLKRKISENRIFEAIRNPDQVLDSYRGRKLRRKKFRNKILEVVTVTEKEKVIVVTQYYLDSYDESKIRSKH